MFFYCEKINYSFAQGSHCYYYYHIIIVKNKIIGCTKFSCFHLKNYHIHNNLFMNRLHEGKFQLNINYIYLKLNQNKIQLNNKQIIKVIVLNNKRMNFFWMRI